jgi:uncharacterized protein
MHTGTDERISRKRRNSKAKPSQQTAIRIAKRFISEVEGKGISIRHAILFGSFAKNKQHEWSDIDLALVSDDFNGVRFWDNRLIQDIKIKKPYSDVETHTYNTVEFEKGDNGFIDKEIKAYGISLI